jgi:hypothetical protein
MRQYSNRTQFFRSPMVNLIGKRTCSEVNAVPWKEAKIITPPPHKRVASGAMHCGGRSPLFQAVLSGVPLANLGVRPDQPAQPMARKPSGTAGKPSPRPALLFGHCHASPHFWTTYPTMQRHPEAGQHRLIGSIGRCSTHPLCHKPIHPRLPDKENYNSRRPSDPRLSAHHHSPWSRFIPLPQFCSYYQIRYNE